MQTRGFTKCKCSWIHSHLHRPHIDAWQKYRWRWWRMCLFQKLHVLYFLLMWGLGICVAAQVNKIMIHIPRSFPVTLKRNQAQAFALYSRYLISIQLWFKVFYNAVRRLHFIQLPRSTWEREAWWWSLWWSKSCTCSYRWSWSDLAFVTNIVCASKDRKPSLCLLFILSSIPFPPPEWS